MDLYMSSKPVPHIQVGPSCPAERTGPETGLEVWSSVLSRPHSSRPSTPDVPQGTAWRQRLQYGELEQHPQDHS